MPFPDLVHQQVEIPIARGQHNHVGLRCILEDLQGDADVPVALCGSIPAPYEGLELHLKSYGAKYGLKLPLFLIIAIDRKCDRLHDFSVVGDLGPKPVVVEMTRELLPRRVINVLNIDEDGNGFQFALAHGIGESRPV